MKEKLTAFFTDKFYPLLTLQVVFILILPILRVYALRESLIIAICLSGILLLGTRVIAYRRFRHLAAAISVLFVVLIGLGEIKSHPGLFLATFLLFFVAFVIVTSSIINRLLRSHEVRLSLIAGSIAGYLMIGITLAFFLLMLGGFVQPVLNKPIQEIGFQGTLYYALITMITIGFGDISPVHPFAQNITALAGVLSQFYMAVVVAVIVGKVMAERNDPTKTKSKASRENRPHI